MAEAFARTLGAGVINAASAGLSPAPSIARETVEVMRERGLELNDHFPKDFEPSLAETHDVVVNISGFRLPALRLPEVIEWSVRDPYGRPVEEHRLVRDEIERRVVALIADVRNHEPIVSSGAVGQRIAPKEVRRTRLWQRFTRWR